MSLIGAHTLSIPSILSAVLDQVINLFEEETVLPDQQDGRLHSYRVCTTTSLVARAWKNPSQRRLHRELHFSKGTKQLERWLESIGDKEYINSTVVFFDSLPFKEGIDAKWDFKVVKRVLERIEGCQSLFLAFMGQKSTPADLLTSENLAGLRMLMLGSPLDETTSKPPFSSLETLVIKDEIGSKLARDWSSTFTFITSPPDFGIRTLNLANLPTAANYLLGPLLPIAGSIVELELPNLEYAVGSGSLFTFAQACTQLNKLHIAYVGPTSTHALCLLLVFPPSLQYLHISFIQGSLLGHYDDSIGGQRADTYKNLLDTLELLTGNHLKFVFIEKTKWLWIEFHERIRQVMSSEGMIWTMATQPDLYLTPQEDLTKRSFLLKKTRETVVEMCRSQSITLVGFDDKMEDQCEEILEAFKMVPVGEEQPNGLST